MTTSRNGGWLSRKILRRQKAAQRKTPYRCRLGFEPLEERRMLALDVPPMSSAPFASQTLYLDFDGSDPFLWDGAGTGTPYVVRRTESRQCADPGPRVHDRHGRGQLRRLYGNRVRGDRDR